MIEQKVVEFLSWEDEVKAACVALHNALSQRKTPRAAAEPPMKCSPKKPYRPKPHWNQDERLELFAEFDAGNRNWRELGKRFQRTSGAIRAQYDTTYQQFKG